LIIKACFKIKTEKENESETRIQRNRDFLEMQQNCSCSTLWELLVRMHSKKCWFVSTQIWVKFGRTQMLG